MSAARIDSLFDFAGAEFLIGPLSCFPFDAGCHAGSTSGRAASTRIGMKLNSPLGVNVSGCAATGTSRVHGRIGGSSTAHVSTRMAAAALCNEFGPPTVG